MAELSNKVKEFLSEPRFAVLATINRDGTPQQTVVWYELQGDSIMMNTRVGRLKEKNLRRDVRLSFCVPQGYSYVTIKGTAELDYDAQQAHEDIRRLAIRYHGPEKGEKQFQDVYSKQQRVTIYMSLDQVNAYGL